MKANRKDKKDNRQGLLKWQNTGRASARIYINEKLKIIKPGEKFKALDEEVPVAFRDKLKCLNEVVKEPTPDSKDGVDIPKWELLETDGGFFVYDPVSKKKANEEPLEKEAAEKLLKEKQAETEEDK